MPGVDKHWRAHHEPAPFSWAVVEAIGNTSSLDMDAVRNRRLLARVTVSSIRAALSTGALGVGVVGVLGMLGVLGASDVLRR